MPMDNQQNNNNNRSNYEDISLIKTQPQKEEDIIKDLFLNTTNISEIYILLNEYPFFMINQKNEIRIHVMNLILDTLAKDPIENYLNQKFKPKKSKELLTYMENYKVTEDTLELFSSIDYYYNYTSHTASLSLLSRLSTIENQSIEIFSKIVKYISYNNEKEYNYLDSLITFKIIIYLIDLDSFIKKEVSIFATLKNDINTFLSFLLNEIMSYTSKLSESLKNEYIELSYNSKEFQIDNLEKKIYYKKIHSKLKMLFTTLSEFISIAQTNYGQNALFLTSNIVTMLSNFILSYLQFFSSVDLTENLDSFINFENIPDTLIHLHIEPFSKILKYFQFIDYFNLDNPRNRQFDEKMIKNTSNVVVYALLPFLLNNISNISIYQNIIYNTIISLSSTETILKTSFNLALEKNIFTDFSLINEELDSLNPNLQMLVVESKIAFNIRHLIRIPILINIIKKFKYHILRTMDQPIIKSYNGRIEGCLNNFPFMIKKPKDLGIQPTVENLHIYMLEKQKELPKLHFTHILQLFASLNESLGLIHVDSLQEKQSAYIELIKLMYISIADLNKRYKCDLMIFSSLNIFNEYREYVISLKNNNLITEEFIENVYDEYENNYSIEIIRERYDSLFVSFLVIFNSITSFINEKRDQNSKLPQVINNLFLLICEEIFNKENFSYLLTNEITNNTLHTLCIISTCFLNIDTVSFEYILKRLINNIMYLSSITVLFFAIFKKTASTNIFIYNELSEILEKEITKYLNTSHLETYEKSFNEGNDDITYRDFMIYMFQITSSMLTSFKTYKFLKKISYLIELADTEHTLYFECLFTLLADISLESQEKHYLNFTQTFLKKNLEILTDIHFGEFPITHSMMKRQIETINAFIVYTHTNNLEEQYFRTSIDYDLRNQVKKVSGDTGKDFLTQNLHLYTKLVDNLLYLSLCQPENYAIDKIVHTLYPLQSTIFINFYLYFLNRAIYKGDIYWVSVVFSELFTNKYFMTNKISITKDIEIIDIELNPKKCIYFLKKNPNNLLYNLSRALDIISDHKLYGDLIIKIGHNYIPNITTRLESNKIFIRDALEYYYNRMIDIRDPINFELFSIENIEILPMIYNWKGIESSIVSKHKECEKNKHMELIAFREIVNYLNDLKLDYISWMCICSLAYNNNIIAIEYINKYIKKYDYSCLCLENSYKCKEKCTEERYITINLFIDSIIIFTNKYMNNKLNICCLNSIIYTMSLLINNPSRGVSDLTLKILPSVFYIQFYCTTNNTNKNIKKVNTTLLVQLLSSCLQFEYLNTKNNQISITQTIKNILNEIIYRIQNYKYLSEGKNIINPQRNPIEINLEEISIFNNKIDTDNNTLNCFDCCYNQITNNTLFLITQKLLFNNLLINFHSVSDLLISFLDNLKYPLNNYIQANYNIVTNKIIELSQRNYKYELILDLLIFFNCKQHFDIPGFMLRSLNEFLTNKQNELNNRLFFKTLQHLNRIVKSLTLEEADEYLDILIKTMKSIYCNKCIDYEIKSKIIEESTIENMIDCEEAIREVTIKINPIHFSKDHPAINSYLMNLTCHFDSLKPKLTELIYKILYEITENTIHWSIILNINKIEPNFFNMLILKNEKKVPFSTLLIKYFCIQKYPSNELIEISARICNTIEDYKNLLNYMKNRDLNFLKNIPLKPILLELLIDIYKSNNNTILFIMECLNILNDNPNNEKLITSICNKLIIDEPKSNDLKYLRYSLKKDISEDIIELVNSIDIYSRDVSLLDKAIEYKNSEYKKMDTSLEIGLIFREGSVINFNLYSKIESFYITDEFIDKLINMKKVYISLILLTKEYIYNKNLINHILELKYTNSIPIEYLELYNIYLSAFILKHISESTNYGDDKMFYYFFIYVAPYLNSSYEISREVLKYSDTDYNQIIFINCMDRYYLTLISDLTNRIYPLFNEIRETCYDQFIEYCKLNKDNIIYSLYKVLTAPTLQFRILAFKIRNIILELFETKNSPLYKAIYMDYFMLLLIEPKIQFTETKLINQKHKLYLNDFIDNEVLPDILYLNNILLNKMENYCNFNAKKLLELEYKKVINKNQIELIPFFNKLIINFFRNISKTNVELDYEFIKLLPPNFLIRHSIEIKINGKNFYTIMVVLYEYCVSIIYYYLNNEKKDIIKNSSSYINKIINIHNNTNYRISVEIFQVLDMISNLSQALKTQIDSIKIQKEDMIIILILTIKLMELRSILINKQGNAKFNIPPDINITIEEIDFIPFLLELSINKELSLTLSDRISDMFKNYNYSINIQSEDIISETINTFNKDLYKIVFSIIDITTTKPIIRQLFKDLDIPYYNKLIYNTNKIIYNSNNCNKSISKPCNCLDLYLFNSIKTRNNIFKFMNSNCFSVKKLIFEDLLFKQIKNTISSQPLLPIDLRVTDEILKGIILDLFKYLKVNINIYLKRNIKWFILQILQIYICYIENKKSDNKYYLINNTRDEIPIELFNNLLINYEGFIFLKQLLDILYYFNDIEIIKISKISNYININTNNINLYKQFKNTPLIKKRDFLKNNILKFDQTNDKYIFTLINEILPSFEEKHILKYKLNLKNFINYEYEEFRKLINDKTNKITFNDFIAPLNYETAKLFILNYIDYNEKALEYTIGKDENLYKELYKIYFQGDGNYPLILKKEENSFINDREFLNRFEIIYKNHTNSQYTMNYQYLITNTGKMACYNENPEYSLELIDKVLQLPFIEGSYLLYHYLYTMITFDLHYNDEDYKKCINRKIETKSSYNLQFFNINLPGNVDNQSLYFFQIVSGVWLINRIKNIVFDLENPINEYLKGRQTQNKSIYRTKSRNEKISINILDSIKSQITDIEYLFNSALIKNINCEAWKFFIDLYLFYPVMKIELEKYDIDITGIEFNDKLFKEKAFEAIRFDDWIFLHLLIRLKEDDLEILGMYFFKKILLFKDLKEYVCVILRLISKSNIDNIPISNSQNNCLIWLILAFAKEVDCTEYFYHQLFKYNSILSVSYINSTFNYIEEVLSFNILIDSEKRIGTDLIRIDSNLKTIIIKSLNKLRIFKIEKYTEKYTKEILERSNLTISLYTLFTRNNNKELDFQEDLKNTKLKKCGFKISIEKTILFKNYWLREIERYNLNEFNSLNKLKKLFSSNYINYRRCITDLIERYSSIKVLNNIFNNKIDSSKFSFSNKKDENIITINLILLDKRKDIYNDINLLDKLVESTFSYEEIEKSVTHFIKQLKRDGKLNEMISCYLDDTTINI